jgi:Putative member of DMT superfamily (DUF486)
MTLAWYGHLRFKQTPLIWVILVAWLIAFFEYCLAVSANRYGSAIYTAAQLKTMQEVITLLVFAGFSVAIGFALIPVSAGKRELSVMPLSGRIWHRQQAMPCAPVNL